MSEKLTNLLNTIIEKGNDEDIRALTHALEGMNNKVNGKNSTFIGGLLHMERKIENQICEIKIPINQLLNNSLDIVHGGITATLMDTAMGTLANSLLPQGFISVTSQLNIHYLAPGKGEFLQCRAAVSHHGKKTLVITAEVFRSDGKKTAQGTGSFFVIEKK